MSKTIRIVWIPNQIKKDGRIEKKVEFVRGTTLREYLNDTGFTYGEGWHVLSARFGKITDVDAHIPDGDDEILIIRDLRDPFTIGTAIFTALSLSSIVSVSAAYATVMALGWIAILSAVAVVGFGIFSAFQKPKRPSFGAIGGTGGSLEESSPTYGWDGIRTVQDVGIPVALIYGTHRVGGNIINQYTWNDGNKEYLNLLLALGEGEIEDISNIMINDNPFENFTDLDKFERFGTNTQDIIEGFEELHNVVDVGAMLPKDQPYTYTTQDDDIEGFEVEITCPYGLYEVTSGGDQIATSAKYKVEYRTHGVGDYTVLDEETITDSSRTVVRRKFKKDGLTAGKYDIRVTRTSDDSTTMIVRDLRLNRIDEIKNDDLAYPNTALLGLKLLASDQLSGMTPNITALVKGLKIKTYKVMNGEDEVPYEEYYWDEDTSEFKLLEDDTVLSWDGETYSTAYSANPVWILYDLITNSRYGLGEFISASHIDLAQFVEMAKYCDGAVEDGAGGWEKRFELNVVLDSAHSALDILIQLTASFRAWAFYSAGTIKLKIDKPEAPTQMFGMGNIIDGSFQQAWKALKDVPNVIDVQYLDAAKNYEQEIVAYIDEASLASNPMRKRSVRVFVTKASRAVREARYALLISQYIHRSISFKAAIDAIACQAGDVISVTHDVPNWGKSGRVKSGTAGTIVLDQTVTIQAGVTYKVQVRHGDDSIEEKTVTNAAGSTATLTISGAWTTTPAAGAVWFFGETNVYKKNFRIISMRRGKDNEIEIQAMEHSPLVFDDSAPTLPDSNFTDPTAGIPSVENLALTERIVKMPDGTIQNVIDVWWTKPDTSAYPFKQWQKAKIYLSDNSGTTYALQGESDGTTFAIMAGIQERKAYKVAVTSVNMIGEEKSITLCPTATITVMGKALPPSDVTGFASSFASDHIHFTWNHITDVDLDGYEIRELPYPTAPWSLGIPIGDRISQNSFDYFLITSLGNRYFAIKAIDTTGNYSLQAAYASLVIVDLPNLNVIKTIDFDLRKGAVSGAAERILFKGYSEDFYRTALALMSATTWDEEGETWDEEGATWDIPVSAEEGTYITEVMDLGGNIETSVNLSVGISNTSGGRLTAYIAYSDSDATPDDWVPFANGQYTGRYFRFKLVFSSDDENEIVTIYKLKAVFDVPDKEDYGLAITVPDTGWTTVTFTKSFIEIKALLVSVTGSALIAELDQTDLPASFDVKLKDGGGAQQAGTINFWAKGY